MVGVIIKALAGFYYVSCGEKTIECKARGRFRLEGVSPLVGDRAVIEETEGGRGIIRQMLERRNSFLRPAVANIDLLVIIAANVNPVTDPYLIDRVAAIAESSDCDVLVCINKSDLEEGDRLFDIYKTTGYTVLRTSAETGEGLGELRTAVSGKVCAFTGNSGVGKSSVLNALDSRLDIKVGKVSEKLGRGKHTTRHVEFFDIGDETYIADTPGFASFDMEMMEPIRKEELQFAFREFAPHIGGCQFNDCAHINEPNCAILEAVNNQEIHPSRHASYVRMYELAAKINDWERK